MKAFRNAIQTPLNEKEDFYFGQVFLANPNYGLLPFLLLHDRFDELQAAVVNIWNNPADPSTVPVLHRVVSYCAELFGNRRAADQEYKRRSQAKNKGGQLAIEINIETPDGDLRPEQNFFLELTKALGVRRGIESDVGDWEARLIRQSETTIQLELRCAEPTCVKKFTVPRSEFEAVARTLRSL